MGYAKQQTTYLRQNFLIAMPQRTPRQFIDALTYVCEHSEDGAMGVIVNYPLELTLADMLVQMGIKQDPTIDCSQSVYYGGPVQCGRGFILHRPHGDWYASLAIDDDLVMTTSRDILEAMAVGKGPQDAMVFLGYSGWAAGELETEMANNTWLNSPVDLSILFNVPCQQRRQAAARILGIDLTRLSNDTGHA